MSGRAGWTRVAFGDVVRQVKDRVDPEESGLERYVAGEHMDTDDLRIRRWGTIGDGYLGPAFHMRFQPGQVLYGSRRTYLRKVAVADFEGITANTTFVLEPKDPDVLLPELLPFVMQTAVFHEHAIKQSKGSVNPYINFSDLTWFEFPLPPIDEQRRIAAALASVQAAAEALRRTAEALAMVVTAVFADLHADAASSQSLPVLELTTEPPRNGFSPPPNSEGRGLKTVSISAIRENAFDPSGCIKHAAVDPEAVQPFLVRAGDVFVVRGNGNRALCGQAGLSEQSYEDLFYPDLLIRLRFDDSKLLPAFAVAQWNSLTIHRQLMTRAKSSNGIWKINGEDVRVHRLLVPPISEQVRLVERLRNLQRQSSELAARRSALADLRTMVLTRSFAA